MFSINLKFHEVRLKGKNKTPPKICLYCKDGKEDLLYESGFLLDLLTVHRKLSSEINVTCGRYSTK